MNKNEEAEVEKVSGSFYSAFENLSIGMMERVWSHNDNVTCIHPGWEMFTGWLAVRDSWITIFQNTESIKLVITNARMRIIGKAVIVVCLENIESTVGSRRTKFGVIATNVFEQFASRNGQAWRMIHHHGSPVANYMPPNISI